MRNPRGYLVISISIIVVFGLFNTFSDDDADLYEHTGIVYDVRETNSGFSFYLQTSSSAHYRCFSFKEPDEIGYYALNGDFSEDGSILFVTKMLNLDRDDP